MAWTSSSAAAVHSDTLPRHRFSGAYTHTVIFHCERCYDLMCVCVCFLRSIVPIHPSFRVVALAEPPVVSASTPTNSSSSGTQQWLSPELLTMFLYHTVPPMTKAEEMDLILGLVRHSQTHNTPNIYSLMTKKEKKISFSCCSVNWQNTSRCSYIAVMQDV